MGATRGTVRLVFGASAVHVRTARLVAVTVARRGERPEDQVECVRQSVGEACALALRSASPEQRIAVEIDDDTPGLIIRVWPVIDAWSPAGALPRAVLVGLTDSMEIDRVDGLPALRLTWIS